jgi:lipooligosaccharide transport system permease protein
MLKIPRITYLAFRVWQRNGNVWLKFYRASLIGNVGEPIFFLVALGYGLGRFMPELGGITYVQFLAPGIVLSSAMYSAAFECTFGSFTRMTTQKTYDAIICTPVSIEEVIAGEVIWGATKSLVTGAVILVIISLFGLMKSPLGILVIFLVFFEGIMFSGMSLIFTAFAPSYDFFSYYFTLVITPMFLFSGVFFPLEGMPEWVNLLSWFMPLTHAVNLGRGLVMGAMPDSSLLDVCWIIFFAVAVFYLSIYLIRRRLIK